MTLIILLFSIGLLLLAAEVMVPGGILGAAGGLMLFAGCILSFVLLGDTEGFIAIAVAASAAIALFYIQFKILPKTRIGKRFFLSREISASSTALNEDARDLIGKTAQSVTVLSPSGYVTIAGKRFEAFSQSGHIAPGTDLEVIDANSFQLIVRTKH
jgi:membrane-bound ClpP family serine protease